MTLTYIILCGVTLGPLPPVPPTLELLYQQNYGCAPQQTRHHIDDRAIARENAGELFPAMSTSWPVFTKEQVGGDVYLETLKRGIKPGILLPNDQLEMLKPSLYFRYKTAMQDGAIPVLEFQSATPNAFSAKATYAAAIGLSPLAALVTDGWSENAPFLHEGTYLFDHRPYSGYRDLPMPARENHVHNSYLYYAANMPAPGGGFSVVINPSVAPRPSEVKYPRLGMTWEFADNLYVSTPNGLKSNIFGYLTGAAILFAVPTGLMFARPMPDVLLLFGSSLSWISVLIGVGLFLILGASILSQQRRK